MSKSHDAFRTISEVSDVLDTPAHVLRFWESKFTQVKPVKRAGGRRYYRPADVDLIAGIKKLLHVDGMTIKGVQKLLREQGVKQVVAMGADILGSSKDQVTADFDIEVDIEHAPSAPADAINVQNGDPRQNAPIETSTNASVAPAQLPAPTMAPAQTTETDADSSDARPQIPDVPADPSDGDIKVPARLFHLLRNTPPDALQAHAAEIAPLLDRMRSLRNRISLR